MEFSVERYLAENLTAVGFEGGAEIVNVDAAELGHQPVGTARGETAEPEIVDAILAPSADDVIALGNFLEEKRNVGRIVLQIAVHGDDVFAASVIETGGEACGLAEVAAQFDDGHPAIDGCDFTKQGEGSIDGAIVDEDHFKGFTARLHDGLEPRVEVGDVFLLVVEGDDD